jgi:hypothetical protein
MNLVVRSIVASSSAALLLAFAAGDTYGQAATPPALRAPYQQQISANPFGLLLELFNAEYERVVGETVTTGLGGSYWSSDDDRYINADVFLRYYPQGQPLQQWAFGVKAGLTSASELIDFSTDRERGTYFGLGFDVNHSWLLGRNDNFYVGIGFGLKRLFGTPDDYFGLDYIPTLRIVNIGFAF